jgi:hypothetical protein
MDVGASSSMAAVPAAAPAIEPNAVLKPRTGAIDDPAVTLDADATGPGELQADEQEGT